MSRDVELSLFPDVRPDRPVGPLLGSVQPGTNAELVARIAPLYLTDCDVLDVTYGRGKWWDIYRPERFTFHDLALDGVDFRDLPHDDDTFDAVTFDPPYIPAGGGTAKKGRTTQSFLDRFGVGYSQPNAPKNRAQLRDLITAGMAECARVLRPGGFLLCKGTDYVTGGAFTLGHLDYLSAANELRLTTHDLIVHHTGPGPGGHNIFEPLRARRHHSYLLVFTAPP